MSIYIQNKTNAIFEKLRQNPRLAPFVDWSLPIPRTYCGTDEIKLVVLGQDPTIKNAKGRKHIQTVLNLDKTRSVWAYLAGVCKDLDLKLKEHIYATNLYKNFFVAPPTQIAELNIFHEFLGVWLPLFMEEIDPFPHAPVITLGEPILAPLIKPDLAVQVRHYWGYKSDWEKGGASDFGYIKPDDNHLDRLIFPFPHQPSLRKRFYKTKLKDYTAFVKTKMFNDNP